MMNKQSADLIQQLAAEASQIEPSAEQLSQLKALTNPGPWHFVNLLAFYDEARYPEGHELHGKGLTGEQAYNRYGKVALEHVTRRGGELITLNTVHHTVIGQTAGWARLATMQYPNIDAFLDMIQDPDYRAALVHRSAGLSATVLLATQPI